MATIRTNQYNEIINTSTAGTINGDFEVTSERTDLFGIKLRVENNSSGSLTLKLQEAESPSGTVYADVIDMETGSAVEVVTAAGAKSIFEFKDLMNNAKYRWTGTLASGSTATIVKAIMKDHE
jgi:bacillopeptidase F (M6 metalloprotease family)